MPKRRGPCPTPIYRVITLLDRHPVHTFLPSTLRTSGMCTNSVANAHRSVDQAPPPGRTREREEPPELKRRVTPPHPHFPNKTSSLSLHRLSKSPEKGTDIPVKLSLSWRYERKGIGSVRRL